MRVLPLKGLGRTAWRPARGDGGGITPTGSLGAAFTTSTESKQANPCTAQETWSCGNAARTGTSPLS